MGANSGGTTWTTATANIAHTHTFSGTTGGVSANHTHTITAANLKTAIGAITFKGDNLSTTGCTNCAGSAFSVQNPYITVYMYKRIA